jgi:hypothetical protein
MGGGAIMSTLRLSLVGMVILALLGGSASATLAQSETHAPRDAPTSVLFVGNSYTYWNDGVDTHVAALAASEDPPRVFNAEVSKIPSSTLRMHWEQSEPESSTGAVDAIREGAHDIVVLQEGITEFYQADAAPFLEYAGLFDEEIKKAGARTVFYMTWPVEPREWPTLDDIVAAHRQVEADLGAVVAPVAVAMDHALAERPDLAMIGPDLWHPTMAGTYLAAATIYATLYDQSPEGLPYHPADISADDAAFLQRVAWETVLEWRQGETAE